MECDLMQDGAIMTQQLAFKRVDSTEQYNESIINQKKKLELLKQELKVRKASNEQSLWESSKYTAPKPDPLE